MKKFKHGVIGFSSMVLVLCAGLFHPVTAQVEDLVQDQSKEWADEWSGDATYEEEESTDMTGSKARLSGILSDVKSSTKSVKVIVLDPGHDNTHAGARGNGFAEEERVLKIAQYCKAELEQYQGVTVYMTRDASGACPYPGTTSAQDNKKRVEYANSVGADAYVSIHLNASTNAAATGTEVYYPNSSYRSDIGSAGSQLAKGVLNELTALGLKNRGIFIRNSEDNSLYPDGSLADYYGVIKNSKLNGFPGIIVEHAFITNASDVNNYLNADDKLQKLGIADATGIAKYYGLQKKAQEQEYTESDLKLSTNPNADATQYTLTAEGISNCYTVQFAVWSMNNGQDDLKWYQAQKDSNGNWTSTAIMSDFKTEGAYAVHTFITRSNGTQYFVGSKNFELINNVSVDRIVVSDINKTDGTFLVTLYGVKSYSGISIVYVPVWSYEDQSDLVWYKAELNQNGNYEVHVKVEDLEDFNGEYIIHAYLKDHNDIMRQIGATNVIIFDEDSLVTVEEGSKGNFEILAENIPYAVSQKLDFAVWSEEGGQDDLVWYQAESLGDGTWKKDIFLGSTATKGLYHVHAYMIGHEGKSEIMGKTTFTVTEDNVGDSIKGDANLDGTVTLEDAQLVLKASLNIIELTGSALENADIDGNNTITLADANLTLRKALNID